MMIDILIWSILVYFGIMVNLLTLTYTDHTLDQKEKPNFYKWSLVWPYMLWRLYKDKL